MERGAGSALFAGFRALGLFSTDVAHVLRFSALKRRFFVTTCVGKSFHTYDVSGLPRRPLPGTPRPRAPAPSRPAPPRSPLPPTCPGSACPPRLLPLPWVSPSPPALSALVLPARPRRAVRPRGNPAGTPGSVTSRLFPHTCEGVLKVYM